MNSKIILFNIAFVFKCTEMSTEVMPAIVKEVILFIHLGPLHFFVSEAGIYVLMYFSIICRSLSFILQLQHQQQQQHNLLCPKPDILNIQQNNYYIYNLEHSNQHSHLHINACIIHFTLYRKYHSLL